MQRHPGASAAPRRRWPHRRAAAALLAACAAPAAADLWAPLPTPALGADGYSLHAESDFGRVYAQVDGRHGAVFGLRYTRSAPGIGRYHHRWRFGLEQRPADSLDPHLTVRPFSVGYAAGWDDDSRNVDYLLAFHRNLPAGRDGNADAVEAVRRGAKAGYSVVRYHATVVQQLPATWRLKLVAAGQYSPHALVPAEQFALGGGETLRGFEERALTGDRGQRYTLELQTPDVGRLVKPRLSAQGLFFLDQGSVVGNQLPVETRRTQAASVGIGVAMSMARSWQLRAELAHVRREGPGHLDLDDEHGRLMLRWSP